MANAKAVRQEVEFPPLLNLQEDRPRVASDFRSVEHINAPYINGMLTPFWKKEYEYINKPVWDYKNNKYEIIDGFLTKNGNNLFSVNNYHFKKEDVTEEFSKYMAFDFSDDGELAKLEWNTVTNSATLTFRENVVTYDNVFINGVILTSRVRVIGDTAIAVIVFRTISNCYMIYMNSAENRKQRVSITWYSLIAKASNAEDSYFTWDPVTIPNPSPIINICSPLENVIGISLVSNFGEVLFTKEEGFFTFVDNNGIYKHGNAFTPNVASKTETIETYQITSFSIGLTGSSLPSTFNVYNRDNTWYYVSDPSTEVPNSDDPYFQPKIMPGQTITYEGVKYTYYQATSYTNRMNLSSKVDTLHGNSASLTAIVGDTTYTDNYTDLVAEIEVEEISWQKKNLVPSSIVITYNNNEYVVPPNQTSYTVTEATGTTTISAKTISCPNVFLDNGNMYAWYTFGTPSDSSSSYAARLCSGILFDTSTLLVESGTLTSITGDHYTFDVIETHMSNSTYSLYARSNSIAVGQNFWCSSTKTSSSGVRSPYSVYVQKQTLFNTTDNIPTANRKIVEYTNSNCSDMLYYAGTLPRNDQKFYSKATANSQDVAWFHPGGFRAELKANWKMLYYIDNGGAVFIQGISYAGADDQMGTMVVPFGSLNDLPYISASNNFVVYKDKNNRYWKISIEEGAILTSVFDNHYIVVNTTSYWNMWDAENDIKFHFATDYNNRAIMGQTRTEFRNNISTYFVELDRRKYATCINQGYNTLPRYPVVSMLPSSFALGQSLKENDISANVKTYFCTTSEAREVQPINIYYQGTNISDSSIRYVCSIKVFTAGNIIYRDGNIADVAYNDKSSILYPPDIFTTYINGAGNNDFAVENNAKYPLIYNNQNKPIFLYSIPGGVDYEDVKWFFVIQGQYYAVIGEKLYAMIYNSGTISQSDAIVDIRDLKFVGNTPAIAFFVNPYTKQVYSFTGDANLQQIFDASKYVFPVENNEITHWYDESTQSIYIKTEQGLLVFGPQNTYCLEEFTGVTDIEFVDGDIHIVNDKVTSLRYYHDIEEYEDLPIKIETSFWGLGANESTSIDRWNITLYDPEHREQDVELTVRSLTDVSTLSETKKLHIDKNGWDKWSHSVLLSYSPKLIKGQAIRLTIKTDSAIQKIIPHIMDNKASTSTNGKFQV